MINQKDKEYIVSAFGQLQNREDLLKLLNFSKKALFGRDAIVFEMSQLTFYYNHRVGGKRYRSFTIPKRSGGTRKIHAPVDGLRLIQQCLNLILKCVYKAQSQAHGFTENRSIKTNAAVHTGNYYVFNVDLKDFFPSIDQARVWKVLQLPPFNLLFGEEDSVPKKVRYELVNIISALCCTRMFVERPDEKGRLVKVIKNVLPQGAPTSPLLSNVICQRLDMLLNGVAKRFGLKYTRYADDITFSALHNVFQSHSPFIREMERVIAEQGFRINEEKVRLQRSGYKQMVTGLIVNEKVNLQKKYVTAIRKSIYLWETYGIDKGIKAYRKDNNLKDNTASQLNLEDILRGKIAFLKDVLGEQNPRYLHYKTRFDKLTNLDFIEGKPVDAKHIGGSIERVNELIRNGRVPAPDASIEELRAFMSLVHFKQEYTVQEESSSAEQEEDRLHDPKFVVFLLEKFTQETNLKYAVHFWDAENRYASYQEFIGLITEDIRRYHFRMLPAYNSRLYWRIIFPFLIQDQELRKKTGEHFLYNWGRYNLRVGYQYPKVVDQWMENNPGKSPFSMSIPPELRPLDPIKGKTLIYFEDFVDVFKQAIEFRGNDLYYLFREVSANILFDFDVQLINLKGISFFTDTHQVEKAIKIVFNAIKKYTYAPNVKVYGKYHQEGKYFDIEVLHLDSFSDKPLDDSKINLSDGRGDFYSIKKLLNSLCDWSIESRFRVNDEYKYYRINYLVSSGAPKFEEVSSAEGFLHRFRFYI